MKSRSGRKSLGRYARFMALALACALLGGLVGNATAEQPAREESVSYAAIYSSDNPVPQIAANVRPAVVQVINVARTWSRQTGEQSLDQGFGSGVYFDERGYIVTNYHVIEGADRVEVLTLDGLRLEAEVTGYDDGTDLAVLRISEDIGAQPVPIGDSDALQIGELAIAIGNPGASTTTLFGTVTAGIISALDREDVNAQNFSRRVSVIQTDAAINTGNSGGALLNARGELIGIPTLKIMYGEGTVYEGLGFAIPINTAAPVIEQLIATGKVLRPRLGVQVTDFDGPDEPLRGYPPAGVQVMNVEDGSPAQKEGVRLYDIITYVDDMRVTQYLQLTSELDNRAAGDVVRLSVYRCFDPLTGTLISQPQSLTVDVTLELLD